MDISSSLSIAVMALLLLIACFQLLLALGLPFGEYAMGGFHTILPKNLRVVSLINAVILLFIGLVFLVHTNKVTVLTFLPTSILVWVFTVFLALNTIANAFSKSTKERVVMTPISGLLFILCLMIVLLK